MTETIVRIVVDGSPQTWCGDKAISPNFDQAREMLGQALDDQGWPAKRALFVVTPGGFIQGRMPKGYEGYRSWDSRPCDFRSLIPTAEAAIWKVIDEDIRAKLCQRSRFLTVGVDLVPKGQSKIGGGTDTRAELVSVVDLAQGVIVRWTGKSYPVSGEEERVLVQEPCLKSHLLCVAGQRVLVLGCHDLNMFSGRARGNTKYAPRQQRWQEMDRLARSFKPTMVLHHPHQTYAPTTWRLGWSGLRQFLGFYGPYASGIAYFPSAAKSWKARCPLEDVLQATKSGDDVLDICVTGYWGRDWTRSASERA